MEKKTIKKLKIIISIIIIILSLLFILLVDAIDIIKPGTTIDITEINPGSGRFIYLEMEENTDSIFAPVYNVKRVKEKEKSLEIYGKYIKSTGDRLIYFDSKGKWEKTGVYTNKKNINDECSIIIDEPYVCEIIASKDLDNFSFYNADPNVENKIDVTKYTGSLLATFLIILSSCIFGESMKKEKKN